MVMIRLDNPVKAHLLHTTSNTRPPAAVTAAAAATATAISRSPLGYISFISIALYAWMLCVLTAILRNSGIFETDESDRLVLWILHRCSRYSFTHVRWVWQPYGNFTAPNGTEDGKVPSVRGEKIHEHDKPGVVGRAALYYVCMCAVT